MRSADLSWKIFAAVIILFAGLLQWYAHAGGLLLTFDSCNYLSASVSFRTEGRFLNSDGSSYAYWGPLMPMLLSVFRNPATILLWAHLFFLVLVGWLTTRLIERITESIFLRVLCLVAIMWSVHILMIGAFLWSELIFLLLLFIFLHLVETAKPNKASFYLAALVGFLLCLQRNAGLFIVTAACVWMWLEFIDQRWKHFHVLIFYFVSTSGFCVWNIYNTIHQSSGFQLQNHDYFNWTAYNFNALAEALLQTYIPLHYAVTWMTLILIAGIVWVLRHDLRRHTHLRLWALVIVFYLAGMSFLFKLDPQDGDRYLAVIIPLTTLLLFRCVDILVDSKTTFVQIVLRCLLVCWLGYPMVRTIKNARQWHEMSYSSKCGSARELTQLSK